ncbi:MAG: hypothetical protein K5784_06875 [Clostridiales bacterium]|nr:hypothetical protein [Clostridiales bacterium]
MKQLILKHKAVTILLGLILIILLYETCYGIYLVFHFSLTVDDIETLSAITGREYYGTEITDIKTHTDFFGDDRGTELYIFLREDAVFDDNPDYDDPVYK